VFFVAYKPADNSSMEQPWLVQVTLAVSSWFALINTVVGLLLVGSRSPFLHVNYMAQPFLCFCSCSVHLVVDFQF